MHGRVAVRTSAGRFVVCSVMGQRAKKTVETASCAVRPTEHIRQWQRFLCVECVIMITMMAMVVVVMAVMVVAVILVCGQEIVASIHEQLFALQQYVYRGEHGAQTNRLR